MEGRKEGRQTGTKLEEMGNEARKLGASATCTCRRREEKIHHSTLSKARLFLKQRHQVDDVMDFD